MELLGLQEIVAQWNLRLLDLAESHGGSEKRAPVVSPQATPNFIRKKN